MRYIDVDVAKKLCQACIMDEEGVILDEFPFDNTFNCRGRLRQKKK